MLNHYAFKAAKGDMEGMRTVQRKSMIAAVCAVLLCAALYAGFLLGIRLKTLFDIFLVAVYLLMMPPKLLNPKNIVFAYYFLWYVLGVSLASKYSSMYADFGKTVDIAYLLCFTTYAVIMVTFELALSETEAAQRAASRQNPNTTQTKAPATLSSADKLALFFCLFAGLAGYIHRTGGLILWLTDSDSGYFSRRGSGAFVLLFLTSLQLLLFFGGQPGRKKKNLIALFGYILLYVLMFRFVGSRGHQMLLIVLLLSDIVMGLDLLDYRSILLGIVGAFIFVYGMFVRHAVNWNTLTSIFNYFDTFENLLLSLRDYPPSVGQTFFLPLNWPLLKLTNIYLVKPFHDMSIWLTTVYYPDTWYVGQGTTQWPIETDLYLSFFYYGGLPFVVLYVLLIAYCYKKALYDGAWQFVYIMEGVGILSHLRGGVLLYWYYYQIPIYLWLILRGGRKTEALNSDGVARLGDRTLGRSAH